MQLICDTCCRAFNSLDTKIRMHHIINARDNGSYVSFGFRRKQRGYAPPGDSFTDVLRRSGPASCHSLVYMIQETSRAEIKRTPGERTREGSPVLYLDSIEDKYNTVVRIILNGLIPISRLNRPPLEFTRPITVSFSWAWIRQWTFHSLS